MHKSLLTAAASLACALATAAHPARAQSPTRSVDCSLLSGQPFVCVQNDSRYAITNISCTGSWGGKTPVSLPSGAIRPNTTAIVKFGSGRCDNKITVVFAGRNPRVFEGYDVETNTTLPVSDD